MKKQALTDSDILSIVQQELEQSVSFSSSTNTISGSNIDIETPLNYYLGNPNGTELEGRSQITSTDVADAIEWILPQVMKSLTQTNEVVVFDPLGPEDEEQAELESEYVYDILMKQNDGFISLHQFVKDALMQGNGILKVYYESSTMDKVCNYTGLTEPQLQMLIADKRIEVLSLAQSAAMAPDGESFMTYSVKLNVKTPQNKICVESVPLENFRISADHSSICPSGARFTAHMLVKTLSDLRQDNIDEKILSELSPTQVNQSNYRFEAQGETTQNFQFTNDESLKEVTVNECYMLIDRDGDGIATLHKITVAGEDNPTHLLSVEPVDSSPWISSTGILMSHKFKGLSIYDRLKTIQDHKTAIWRSILDNMYLQNNQRNKVLEGQVNLDDMLVSRPGGIIRVKRLDAIAPLETPMLSDVSIQMLSMLDETKAGRVGVSAEGTSAPQNIGDRVGSQGVNQLMTAKEELVGLIIRVIAETGIKPLCLKIRDLAHKHVDTMEDFKFRGRWVQLNPTSWNYRSRCSVRVGTGSGDRQQKLAAVREVISYQTAIAQSPTAYLIDENKVFSTLNEFCKLSGLSGATKYMYDPAQPEGQQAKKAFQEAQQLSQSKQEQLTIEQLQVQQQIAQSALQTSQAQMANVTLKSEIETAKNQMQLQKAQYEAKLAQLETMLEQAKMAADATHKSAEIEFKYEDREHNTFVELAKLNNQKDLKMLELNNQPQAEPTIENVL